MQRSLQAWPGEPVTVTYKPFFLNPTIPPEGVDFLSYMEKKGGGRVPTEQFFAGPRQMGQQAGLVFNFLDIPKAPNTLLAHCLIELTPAEKKAEMVEAIYDAFFEHGQDVGDLDTLLALAAQVGLDADTIRQGLMSTAVHDQVKADVQAACQLGVSGVPFFVINNQYAFSGAQPPEAISNILQQITNEEQTT